MRRSDLKCGALEPPREAQKDALLIAINGHCSDLAAGPTDCGSASALRTSEKLNRRPFNWPRLRDKDVHVATVGSTRAGGDARRASRRLQAGVMLHADLKAPPNAVAAMPADREFSSAYPALRAVNPAVSEILIGYLGRPPALLARLAAGRQFKLRHYPSFRPGEPHRHLPAAGSRGQRRSRGVKAGDLGFDLAAPAIGFVLVGSRV